MKNYFCVFTLLILVLIVLSCSCKKIFGECDSGEGYASYKFYLPFTLYPAQDTFHINDTIHLHADFSDMMLDSNTLKYYRVENEPLYCFFTLDHLDTIGIVSAFPNFTLITDTGDTHPGGGPEQGLRLMKYLYASNRYKFHIRLIPHKQGIYGFQMNSFDDQLVNIQDNCPEEILHIYFTLNNGAEANYELFLQSPDSSFSTLPKDVFDDIGGYAFYVVE